MPYCLLQQQQQKQPSPHKPFPPTAERVATWGHHQQVMYMDFFKRGGLASLLAIVNVVIGSWSYIVSQDLSANSFTAKHAEASITFSCWRAQNFPPQNHMWHACLIIKRLPAEGLERDAHSHHLCFKSWTRLGLGWLLSIHSWYPFKAVIQTAWTGSLHLLIVFVTTWIMCVMPCGI